MTEITLDRGLIEAVRSGKAVLFLGAGASFGAKSKSGAKIPMADELKRLIAARFLGPGYEDADFKTVYDFAASNSSVRDLQLFLYETLSPFQPAPFHHLIPTFVWAGLATTNYDLIKLPPAGVRAADHLPQRARGLGPNHGRVGFRHHGHAGVYPH